MTEIILMDSNNYSRYMPQALRLILTHKDNHITREGFAKFRGLSVQDLDKQGNAVALAVDGNKLAGVLGCSDQGKDFAIVVVHKLFREQGLAKAMLDKVVESCGGFYCEVASDNYPSLKTCFTNGLVAYDCFKRYNKIVLKFKAIT